MSVSVVLHNSYEYTCKACEVIRNAFIASLVFVVSITENAGRAKAASELSRMGYHKEAKALMLGKDQDESSNN